MAKAKKAPGLTTNPLLRGASANVTGINKNPKSDRYGKRQHGWDPAAYDPTRTAQNPGGASAPTTGGPMTAPPASTGGGVTTVPGAPAGGGGGTSFTLPTTTQNPFQMGGFDPMKMLQNVYNQASGGGSTTAYNTAANRLRERIDSSTAGNVMTAQNRNLSRGFGVSGINDAAVRNQQAMGQNAYAQGLSDLELGFEDRRLQGLNIAGGAANNMLSGMGGFQELLAQLQGQAMGNANDITLANMDADLKKKLAEMMQQGQNWQAALDLINSDNLVDTGSGASRPPGFSGGVRG